ncbi:MAG: CAP domain-containing protein [Patescibacteria group bacterium]
MLETIAHLFHPRRSNNHRSRLLHPEAYVLLIAVTLGFGLFLGFAKHINTHVGDILGYASDISVQDVVTQTNLQRQQNGVSELSYNDQLSEAAQAKAQDMFTHQYWAHTSPQGLEPWSFVSNAGYGYVSAGENLARDFMHTDEMMSAWMASPTHRDNIVSERYSDIGVAVVNGVLDGIETTLVVQMFGRPAGANASASTPAIPVAAAQESEPVVVPEDQEGQAEAPVVTENTASEPDLEFLGEERQLRSSDSPAAPVSALAQVPKSQSHSMISPLQLAKAFGVSLVILLIMTLLYDEYIVKKHRVVRLVGKNIAHVLFLATVGVIMIIFRGGFVG